MGWTIEESVLFPEEAGDFPFLYTTQTYVVATQPSVE
jgi:hypothetical protein